MDLVGLTFASADDQAWHRDERGRLIGTAPPRTDLFVSPWDGQPTLTAPRLLATPPDGPFRLRARVDIDFHATYDAGCLLLWGDDATWAKLCFEYSPQGSGMAVSVVTRGLSDDANGFTVSGPTLWLRVSRRGSAYAFHASSDGAWWHFVRQFGLGDTTVRLGFEVQSPLGDGVTATFTELSFAQEPPGELRDGS
jgi:regulation of enolase protein 1 (concanavalin A-like superfamily)